MIDLIVQLACNQCFPAKYRNFVFAGEDEDEDIERSRVHDVLAIVAIFIVDLADVTYVKLLLLAWYLTFKCMNFL